jgi:hypothetical protein
MNSGAFPPADILTQILGRFDVLEGIVGDIREIKGTLSEHTGILGEHTRILNEHTRILGEHSRTLAEHSRDLSEIKFIVTAHTTDIREVKTNIAELQAARHTH